MDDHRIAAAKAVLAQADCLMTAAEVAAAVNRVAAAVNAALGGQDERPLALVLMRGGLIFAGQLLPLLELPVDLDYVDATRYGDAISGGELQWRTPVPDAVAGRTVLIIDDVLDEGRTLAAVRAEVLAKGAQRVLIVVFAEKQLGRDKPVSADFTGVTLPDRYLFGYGMDVRGLWRNLPAIYALRG